MPLKLTIELSNRDLRHFQRELKRARDAVSIADDEEILAAAAELVESLRGTELPDFVATRLERLGALQAMLTDADWALIEAERGQILAALAYVCDPEDIIPDTIPGIGLLDDAVMIELVFRELEHEIAAYRDFQAYRATLPKRAADAAARGRLLARRREQLTQRAARRRRADAKR